MKKKRSTAHVIADKGVHIVEKPIIWAGFTAERITKDYGYDLLVTTFTDNGEVENGHIWVQVKASTQKAIF